MDLHKAASMQQLDDVDEQSIHIVLRRELFIFISLTGQRASMLPQLRLPSGDQRRVVLIYFTTNLLFYFFDGPSFEVLEDLLLLVRRCQFFCPLGAACEVADTQSSAEPQRDQSKLLLTIDQFQEKRIVVLFS